jgi:hypothetical protein
LITTTSFLIAPNIPRLKLCVAQGIQLNYTVPESSRELPENVTATKAPYILTQPEFLRILRRNLRGLARLFNMESRKAIEVRLILRFGFVSTACLKTSK